MKKNKIFISYNHDDNDYAQRIKNSLEAENFEVIIDEDSMKTGQKIEQFIKQCINESAVTLSIVSENSLLSAWVAMETIYSTIEQDLRGRYFLPCKIDNIIFDRKFPDKAIDKIEQDLKEIDSIISDRISHNRGIEDLTDERTRFNRLKNELPTIIGNFKNSFCRDLSDSNYDKEIVKVIAELNDLFINNNFKNLSRLGSNTLGIIEIQQSGENNNNIVNYGNGKIIINK